MGGKVREQQRARKLRTQGQSLKQIAQRIGVAKSSVSLWVRHMPLSKSARQRLREREIKGGVTGRKKIRRMWAEYHRLHPKPPPKSPRWPKRSVENFFDTWTPDMAYVLGYFAADGSMYKNKNGSCYVSFYSCDFEILETIKEIMNINNKTERYAPRTDKHQAKGAIQVGSRKLYQRLIELGFTPNKSLILQFPLIPSEVLGHFVRGYFDGDGNIYFNIRNEEDKLLLKPIVLARFTSGSHSFLNSLRQKIREQTMITTGSLTTRKPTHHVLGYSVKAARQLYKFMYPSHTVPCLKRKQEVFKKIELHYGPVV